MWEVMAPIPLLQSWCQELHEIIMLYPLLLSLFLLFSLLYLLKLTGGGKLNLPPSPPKLPIIGNLHQLGALPHRSLQALSKKYGSLMLLNLGNVPTVVVSSVELAREILTTHDAVFGGRPRLKSAEFFFYGCTDVGFCPLGEYWKQLRKICVFELLSLKRVHELKFVREQEVAELIEKIRRLCLTRASVNLGEMLVDLSSRIVTRSVFGLKCEEDDRKQFGKSSRKAMELITAFCIGDFFPSLAWMDVLTGLDARLKETSRALDDFLVKVIKERQPLKGCDQSDKKDLLDIMLRYQKDGLPGVNLTQDNLKAIILDMIIGGIDTTSTTMEWAMAQLAKNPTIMKKAQDEVRRVVGKNSKVEENDLHQMVYLKCIIKETLRFHSPGPLLAPRESLASVKLQGYDIPAKTRLYINAWAIQRDPMLWDNPEEFLPERFENNPVDFKGKDFQYIPFGGGRRNCPGMQFALLEAEYVLANLLYWFDWKLPDGANGEDLDMSEVFGLVVHKKVPLQLVPVLHSP